MIESPQPTFEQGILNFGENNTNSKTILLRKNIENHSDTKNKHEERKS
jgi:hypothetical protein